MNKEIKRKTKRNYIKSFIPILTFLFISYGQSYTQWQKTNFPSTAEVNSITINGSIIFAGTNGDGIFVSTDNGDSWSSINEGLDSKIIHTIFIQGTLIFAGTEAGASISTNNGLNWTSINSGLAGKGVWSFAISKNSSGSVTVFAGTWSGIYSSTDNGKNWVTTGLLNTLMPVNSIIVLDNYIYASTNAGGVFYSVDNGHIWGEMSFMSNDQIMSKVVVQVFSLAQIGTNLLAGSGTGAIYYLDYNVMSFKSLASAPSWSSPILSLASYNSNIFAGADVGSVFQTDDLGKYWKTIVRLPSTMVYCLAICGTNLFAGTDDHGIWRIPLSEIITGINNDNKNTPMRFALEQNYPNPFNPSTKIRYTIPYGCRVSLKVYNVLGELVDDLVDKYMAPGTYMTVFSSSALPSGTYFYTLETDGFRSTKKLTLLK